MKQLVLSFVPDNWELLLQITITEESRQAIDGLTTEELNYWTPIFFDKLISELEKITGPICEGAVKRIQKMNEDDEILISEDLKLVSKDNSLRLYKKHEGCLNFLDAL